MVEIADSVLDPQERQFVQAGASTSRGSQFNASRNKSGLSSRSVMITPPNRDNYQNKNENVRMHNNGCPFPKNQFKKGFSRYQSKGQSFYDRQNQPPKPPPAKVSTGASATNQSNFKFNKSNRLTEKDMADRRASRRCFNCGKEGHMSQNCPERNLLKGGTNKPPGVPSYSMENEFSRRHKRL